MALTFTQVPVTLRISNNTLEDVVAALNSINPDNPNNIYTIETSFHVGSMVEASRVEAGIEILKNLEVLSTYQADNAVHQIDGFRRNYLK
jgi:hypothetical protein